MPQHSLQTLRINKIRPPSNYYHMRLVREVKYFYITDASKKRHVYELTDYDQQRPTNCVRIESEHVAGPYASIQCATLNELTIAGFLVN
ncbi:hypothetical protein RMCBS344292_08257 [Rhizopus microsporus]|nr:hypothetical protein RMCBS344292_08257 [Rhizopus microsporus]